MPASHETAAKLNQLVTKLARQQTNVRITEREIAMWQRVQADEQKTK